eukprot:Pgem_evm1s6161
MSLYKLQQQRPYIYVVVPDSNQLNFDWNDCVVKIGLSYDLDMRKPQNTRAFSYDQYQQVVHNHNKDLISTNSNVTSIAKYIENDICYCNVDKKDLNTTDRYLNEI